MVVVVVVVLVVVEVVTVMVNVMVDVAVLYYCIEHSQLLKRIILRFNSSIIALLIMCIS